MLNGKWPEPIVTGQSEAAKQVKIRNSSSVLEPIVIA